MFYKLSKRGYISHLHLVNRDIKVEKNQIEVIGERIVFLCRITTFG